MCQSALTLGNDLPGVARCSSRPCSNVGLAVGQFQLTSPTSVEPKDMIPSGLNGATKRYMLSPLWDRTSALAALSLQLFAIFSKDSKRLSPTPSLMVWQTSLLFRVLRSAKLHKVIPEFLCDHFVAHEVEQPFTKSISTRVSVIWAAPSAILLTR